ncbi:MAG: putative cytokinetic ring protein SteA [Bacillota bacterium]
MAIRGRVRADRRTKNLIQRLQPNEIAIISHNGIDKLAAQGLIEARCKFVLNADTSLSTDYPNEGPLMLVEAGIPIIDNIGEEILSIPEGTEVIIKEDTVYVNDHLALTGDYLDDEKIKASMGTTKNQLGEVLRSFVDNTLSYARDEIELVTQKIEMPPLKTSFQGKHVLIVVRGYNYKEDLRAISSYIHELHPVLVGVDGGADALMEFGYRPDIVIGDMDSVSDAALSQAKEIVVHAYADGKAPGLERVNKMGLNAFVLPMAGTSEDVAMLLAYEKDASLIVAVGTHSNVLDFLEKGRRGMGSTFLVRLKVGSILIDAKGVSRLYRSRVKVRYLAQVIAAALIPFTAVVVISPPIRQLMKLVIIQFRMLLGI